MHGRQIIYAVSALVVPFVLIGAAGILITTFYDEMTIGHNDVLVRVAEAAALFFSPVVGFLFARRVFPRHVTLVAAIYYPGMILAIYASIAALFGWRLG